MLGLTPLACVRFEDTALNPFSQTPRERYEKQLLTSEELRGSAMVRRWQEAGAAAMRDSVIVQTPFQERGYFSAAEPAALGYRFQLKTGDALRMTIEREPGSANIFGDLFRVEVEDSVETYRHIRSWEAPGYTLEEEINKDGIYLLRVQPELLADCRFTLAVTQYPQLGFPVQGVGNGAVQSFWGAEREGGRRAHEGVDIFAKKGTPLVAVTDGVITKVGTNNLGGNVVWLQDSKRGLSIYYAHLDQQLVQSGQRVSRGDTIGTVGNSGNAKTTPPHLHFGIYTWNRGAIDPLPFIYRHNLDLPRIAAGEELVGNLARTEDRTTNFYLTPAAKQPVVMKLPRHTALAVQGASGSFVRVRLPDGRAGYVSSRAVQLLDRPVDQLVVREAAELRIQPLANAAPAAAVEPGTRVDILARTEGYAYISLPGGERGWLLL